MPNTPNVDFPFVQNEFTVELWTSGNAPDYSTVYAQGVQAARGETETYTLKNCPKGDPITEVEITCNPDTDSMKFNYIGIDYGSTGDGKKWYFVKSKRLLNYPKPQNEGGMNWYTVQFVLELDYWETYKDLIGNPMIFLDQVTTSNPAGWTDISRMNDDILPFSDTKVSHTAMGYSNWKTIVGWQSKKPTDQDNYIIDGMRTTLQFNDNGDLSDYLEGLDELASGSPEETQIWRSYIACNTYVVSEYFSTENGGRSQIEQMSLANPPSNQVHNRLNYYPYKRAFISTVDGQNVEFDQTMYADNKLPSSLSVNVFHSTLPQPISAIYPVYSFNRPHDGIIFSAYPTMDFVGKNITPITQLSTAIADFVDPSTTDWNAISQKIKGG